MRRGGTLVGTKAVPVAPVENYLPTNEKNLDEQERLDNAMHPAYLRYLTQPGHSALH
jgi:hypothetical protein